jgi:polysaccharide export outer membrane protein
MLQQPRLVPALREWMTRGIVVAVISLLAALSGCTEIPRAGPGEVAITKGGGDLAGFTLIDVNADTIGPYMLVRHSDSGGTVGTGYAPRIRLAPGDIIRISIAESKDGGLFAPLAVGGTTFGNVRVDDRGTISIPYAGRVPVAGLDLQRVEARIRSRLAGVTFEPQVYVELIADRSNTVLVTGEVKSPGRFSLLEGSLTIIDAINRAGGASRPAHLTDVVLRRGKEVKRIALASIEGGLNIQLQRGDEIVVEADFKVFNAMGAVTKAGQIEFPKSQPSVLDALATVGGLSNNVAHNTGVFLFRLNEPHAWLDSQGRWQSGPVIFKFNMALPETFFFEQAFALRPDDTIYVTNAPTVEWMRVLAPIAQTMATVRGSISVTNAVENVGGP